MAGSLKNESSFNIFATLADFAHFLPATYSYQICYHGNKERSISNFEFQTFTNIVHSLSSGKVEMFLCAACHAFTPHVNAWKR